MASQPGSTPTFSKVSSNLALGPTSCPTCGREIPPDKLEEIGGRIAAKEREQTLMITAELEKGFREDRARAEAKAKADLESERQQSAAREARARDEAQKAADKLLKEKLAEAEQARANMVTGLQQQLARAEAAQKSAEEIRANVQGEMNELRASTAAAIETLKAEAKTREKEIRDEATRNAESAAAARIAAVESAQRESEVAWKAQIDESEAGRIAAEETRGRLTSELDGLRTSSQAELAKVMDEAATELSRVRQVAIAEAEIRVRDTLQAKESAAAEANARASEAEKKLSVLSDEHALAMETNVKSQREVMEKAKEDAVNAEKAKAFEEGQKLSTKVNELQRALENKTAEELGEGAEVNMFEALKAAFPSDQITRVPKGSPGADLRHVVIFRGKECGTILYDSKNHNQFRTDHVSKLRADQLSAKADHAILSTHKFPQGTWQLHFQDGILLANPARVVVLAGILRRHLLTLHTRRLSEIERENKTAALYKFITSERCRQQLARIDERAESLLGQQDKEIKWHKANWKRQGEAFRAIQKAKADLENDIDLIVGSGADGSALSRAS
jgi:hypothetical protein